LSFPTFPIAPCERGARSWRIFCGESAPAAVYPALTIANHFALCFAPPSLLIHVAKRLTAKEKAAVPSPDRTEGFSGLQQWAEPVIFDRLFAAYRTLLSDDAVAHALTRLHARVWRALISGDMTGFAALRDTLIGALRHCSLTLDHLAEVDNEIMMELLEVVLSRYQRSQRTAKAYHLALMELAGRLGPARAAA
jgi:hypothetical protein